VLTKPSPQGFRHGRTRSGVVLLKQRVTVMTQAEKVQHTVINSLGIGEESTAVHYVHPAAAGQLTEPLQLVGVVPPGSVGVVLMAVAEVTGLADDPLGLTGQPLILQLQGPLERLGLILPGHFMRMGRVGSLDRVAHEHEQLDAGKVTADPLGRQRVEHVIRA
jgi:hypothetical protein